MKKIIVLYFFLFASLIQAQVTLLSWNLKDFGSSKTQETIDFIAETIKNADIVALQEVVAGNGGSQAVAALVDALNRTGSKWDYAISEPTSGSIYKTERYAFLWNTKNIKKIGKPWLEKEYSLEIGREPFYATFEFEGKTFTVASFHAITKKKQPETEIKYFKFLPAQYPDKNIIFAGDFNCLQSHSVFNPLKKMGYVPAFINQKTSLKTECFASNCLASEFDNIFYDSNKTKIISATPIFFYNAFNTLDEARQVSDHIPIAVYFSLN